jgi:hypothetical protein
MGFVQALKYTFFSVPFVTIFQFKHCTNLEFTVYELEIDWQMDNEPMKDC